jgi:Tol biopolymer transport system component
VAPLLAYESDETGRSEIWLRRVPGDASEPPLRVSREGGEAPVWSRDGRTLYFHKGTWLMESRVTAAPELRAAEPRQVLELDNTRVHDVGKDGRFLAVHLPEEPPVTRLEVVFNWFEELRRLVPADN